MTLIETYCYSRTGHDVISGFLPMASAMSQLVLPVLGVLKYTFLANFVISCALVKPDIWFIPPKVGSLRSELGTTTLRTGHRVETSSW